MKYCKFDDDKHSRIKNRKRCHFWVEQLPESAIENTESVLKELCKHYTAIEYGDKQNCSAVGKC